MQSASQCLCKSFLFDFCSKCSLGAPLFNRCMNHSRFLTFNLLLHIVYVVFAVVESGNHCARFPDCPIGDFNLLPIMRRAIWQCQLRPNGFVTTYKDGLFETLVMICCQTGVAARFIRLGCARLRSGQSGFARFALEWTACQSAR